MIVIVVAVKNSKKGASSQSVNNEGHAMTKKEVLEFKIILQDLRKPVWRSIQIIDTCTFWDLHVAIQDAMGWKDYHLHEFTVVDPITLEKEYIGIPHDEGDEEPHILLAGWEISVKEYIFSDKNKKMLYLYDFGDSWEHVIEFKGKYEAQPGVRYPVCLAGERACPPEDVGGAWGYEDFLQIIKDPEHLEHAEWLEWIGGQYHPASFDPKKVKFDNPQIRWDYAFRKNIL